MRLAPLFVAVFAAASLAPAQDVRDIVSPTRQYIYLGYSEAVITSMIQSGHRVVDAEVSGVNPKTFDVTLVEETAPFAVNDWWYSSLDAPGLAAALGQNNARLIDLEPYEDNGQLRFAAVMVQNTGSQAALWSYLYNTNPSAIQNHLNANFQDRLWDLDSYTLGGTTYYSAVFIRNTGSWNRGWSWFVNVPMSFVDQHIAQTGSRPLDLERRVNGNYDVVFVIDPAPTPRWQKRIGLGASEVIPYLLQNGERLTDLDGYMQNGQRLYDIVTILNMDPRSTAVFDQARPLSDGLLGFYLKAVGGDELAFLNRGIQFEPASALKVLHHAHAMRQVQFGVVNLTSSLNVYTAYNGTCPVDAGPSQQPLTNVLRGMMEASDNARTQAVTAYFGQGPINSTAAALGMTSTALNHRIGCAGDALNNPNRTTLADLGRLHELITTGWLGNQREAFYEHMNESLLTCGVEGVLDVEGASLGLTAGQLAAFKAQTHFAAKDGWYYLIDGNGTHMYSCSFGRIRVPRITGGVLTFDEYVVGAFIDNGTNPNTSDLARNKAVQELLRPTLRAALQTFDVDAATYAFGTSCGLFQWTLGGPRLGAITQYATNDAPSSPFVLGIGFSTTSWNGVALPASLVPYGSQAGCTALVGVSQTLLGISDANGVVQIPVAMPANFAALGLTYYTQIYSFGTGAFRTTNGIRSVVGL